jgi:hypothetical protein
MRIWKAVFGTVLGASFFFLVACEEEKEPPKPPPPDPLTACRNECRSTSEQMFQECSDRLREEGAFDRLSECNTESDEYSSKCRAECDKKFVAQTG